ncbi:hypothetical protein [Rhodococcus koreensis]
MTTVRADQRTVLIPLTRIHAVNHAGGHLVEAHDIPDRLVPPNWSPARTVYAAFAAASTTTGLLVMFTTGRPISLGLVLLGLLTFAVMHTSRVTGPYLVLGCLYCRIATSRYRRFFFGAGEAADT